MLLDVFGTLVAYEPDRARLGYPTTHELLTSWGLTVTHDEFVAAWDEATVQLEARSRRTLREFSMADAAGAFAEQCSLDLTEERRVRLGASFVAEWQRHLAPVDGAAAMVQRIAARWRVGVVSNTHDGGMVPAILDRMGLGDLDAVVLSVEHGRCKPHRSIYTTALSLLGVEAERAVFVGDSYEADYVGPAAAGVRSYLIDPEARHPIPPDRRLDSVLDIEPKLTGLP